MRSSLLLVLLVLVVACHENASGHESAPILPHAPAAEPYGAPPPSGAPPAVASPASPTATPLASEWVVKLEAPREPIDFACPPLGATGPRPIVVALHGMDARPEWVCNDFHATFGSWPWVICARGDVATKQNWSWGSVAGMQKAVARVVARVKERWPEYVTDDGSVLATYSQSASMAPGLLADAHAHRFASGFFLEGFSKDLPMYAPAIAQHGLQRAVFFATQQGNRAPADRSARALGKAGIASFSLYGGALGHWFTPNTVPALRKGVPDAVRDLPAWSGYPGPPDS